MALYQKRSNLQAVHNMAIKAEKKKHEHLLTISS